MSLADFLGIVLQRLSLRSSRPSRMFAHAMPQSPLPKEDKLTIPPQFYLEHAAIFAPSGHGKTQLLQTLIIMFLDQEDPPSMFIIDSQGEMLRKIERLECFNPDDGVFKDRLVVLDPEDPNPPALNLFQLGNAQDATIDELFQYLFTAIDSTLTAQQSTTVTYLLRLMGAIPNATIDTLRKVMEDKAKSLEQSAYKDYILTLDPITQDFFGNQFYSPGPMQVTRNSVARRLYALLANPTFVKIFAAPENRFDALKAMQEKKVVLINTSQLKLGQSSTVFGRYFIASILSAAYRRPEYHRPLALLIVDEASEYFDEKTERLLSTARKFGLGMISASQFLGQMSETVKAAISGNTAIKMAGPVSYQDAQTLGREMYVDGEFIRAMKKDHSTTEFAVFVRSLTKKAIKLSIPFGAMERLLLMSADQHTRFREANRADHGSQATYTAPSPTKPTILPHETHVTFPHHGVTVPAVLDSGAYMTCMPVDNLSTANGIASFDLSGTRITAPLLRMQPLAGFTRETATLPVVTLKMTVGGHTADEEIALSLPGTTFLIGRTFMAGRIIVDTSAQKRW